jgi:hypothetical protein
MKQVIIAGLASLAALTLVQAGETPKDSGPTGLGTEEAKIPFVNMRDAIITWEADGQTGLWIQDRRKQWYYATMFAPCDGLQFAVTLGFKTRTLNQLDRDSEIVVPDNPIRCALKSLRKSDPPPKGKGKRHTETTDQTPKDAPKDK